MSCNLLITFYLFVESESRPKKRCNVINIEKKDTEVNKENEEELDPKFGAKRKKIATRKSKSSRDQLKPIFLEEKKKNPVDLPAEPSSSRSEVEKSLRRVK